ncbi:MBL fold metallo-hydrolase [Paenibacillus sp. CF384]|uniref:MBL fold metallo-hydrolase n=1 Tax=Paenibacillus sp. CF384 TaxID=1884382 RepID=UPI00210D12C5|nr:MBL fold metallo-hydrolase [Paenibacillus sp. CF384]
MIFLGTAAAEGCPCYYCRCDYCNEVRKRGGKDIRTRSSFRIDGKHQIDFSPDIFYQMQTLNLDVFELEHLLITHTHEDHFDLAEIIVKECAVDPQPQPLNIYLSQQALPWAERLMDSYSTHLSPEKKAELHSKYVLVPLDYFETYTVGDLVVTPVKSSHHAFGENELALNYMISIPSGHTMLYACDTGWYPEETWDYLSGKKLDLLIMECTFGGRQDRGLYIDGHLDIPNFLLMLERMESTGLIDEQTPVYATHINHKHHLLHDEMQTTLDQSRFNVIVAYDGLQIFEA